MAFLNLASQKLCFTHPNMMPLFRVSLEKAKTFLSTLTKKAVSAMLPKKDGRCILLSHLLCIPVLLSVWFLCVMLCDNPTHPVLYCT